MARFVLIFLLCFSPTGAVAQVIPLFNNAPELRVTPASPAPDETVIVQVVNTFGTLGDTLFVWRVDGKIVDQGIGRNSISITVGKAGDPTLVSVSTSINGSASEEKTIEIQPASVDIVWEGNTYTPPFYVGRPLPNGSSSITALAVPYIIQNGSVISADELVYSWYVDNSATPKKRGYGLKSISLSTPQFENEFTILVRVATRDGGVQAEGRATIKPSRADIVVYEKAPLLGTLFNRAIQTQITSSEEEVMFIAYPLFVVNALVPNYTWRINRDVIAPSDTLGREITLRRTGEGGGSSYIDFSLENSNVLFERASKRFQLNF